MNEIKKKYKNYDHIVESYFEYDKYKFIGYFNTRGVDWRIAEDLCCYCDNIRQVELEINARSDIFNKSVIDTFNSLEGENILLELFHIRYTKEDYLYNSNQLPDPTLSSTIEDETLIEIPKDSIKYRSIKTGEGIVLVKSNNVCLVLGGVYKVFNDLGKLCLSLNTSNYIDWKKLSVRLDISCSTYYINIPEFKIKIENQGYITVNPFFSELGHLVFWVISAYSTDEIVKSHIPITEKGLTYIISAIINGSLKSIVPETNEIRLKNVPDIEDKYNNLWMKLNSLDVVHGSEYDILSSADNDIAYLIEVNETGNANIKFSHWIKARNVLNNYTICPKYHQDEFIFSIVFNSLIIDGIDSSSLFLIIQELAFAKDIYHGSGKEARARLFSKYNITAFN